MQSPFQFLIETIFNLYMMVIMLRFLLQLFRADFYNPLSQFIVQATNPLLIPMRKVIPGYGGIDISSLLLAYSVSLLKFILLYLVLVGNLPGIARLALMAIADLLNQGIYLIFGMVIIRAIISWISPGMNNPIMAVIHQLTEPMMAPLRRIIPPLGGLDLSPLILLLGLQFSLKVLDSWIIGPLMHAL